MAHWTPEFSPADLLLMAEIVFLQDLYILAGGDPGNVGGGGPGTFTILTATGSVNGSNTAFSFVSAPDIIVSDTNWYRATASNGTVFWTIAGTDVTMVNPPGYDIFGVKYS